MEEGLAAKRVGRQGQASLLPSDAVLVFRPGTNELSVFNADGHHYCRVQPVLPLPEPEFPSARWQEPSLWDKYTMLEIIILSRDFLQG